MPVFVNNLQVNIFVEDQLISEVTVAVETALAQMSITGPTEVSVVFVDDDYIAELNKQYRHLEGPTDVLSFPQLEGPLMPQEEQELLLGDVVVSLERASSQAQEYGHSLNREICYLVVHGVLHLLGYDHHIESDYRRMRSAEQTIMAKIGLER